MSKSKESATELGTSKRTRVLQAPEAMAALLEERLEGRQCRFCNQCLGPWYCSTECQAAHWPVHKEECSGQPIRLALLQHNLPEDLVALVFRFAWGRRPRTEYEVNIHVTQQDLR